MQVEIISKGNVMKYAWRESYKGGDADLCKASAYIGYALNRDAEDE